LVLEQQWDSAAFSAYKSAFPTEAQVSSDALLGHVQQLSASDIKDPALKKLQGYLWRAGYESGFIVTPLFPDVLPRLKQWKNAGLRLAIFSSGSVEAQKLFSRYVGVSKVVKEGETEGQETEDLNPLFEGNYDTVNAGPKMEKWSYELIAKEMGLKECEILFLSDNVKGRIYGPAVTDIMLTVSRDPSSQRSWYASSPRRQTRQCDSLQRRSEDTSSR
jgi:enolase-phosphatase E1